MRFSTGWVLTAGALWLFLIGAGMKAAMEYESAPGSIHPAPARWPRPAGSGTRPHLAVFIHPRCPCTRATVDELLEIAARAHDRVEIDVWFYRPSGAAADWHRSEHWRRLAAHPMLRLQVDENGLEARRFGASTSGTALLYNRRQRLVFHGGITAQRGKAGDNPGRRAILGHLTEERLAMDESPVFGCSLLAGFTPPPAEP